MQINLCTVKSAQCDKANPENCKNRSMCAYDCAQLQYTIQHRTVLIISPLSLLPPDKHHSSDVIYRKRGVYVVDNCTYLWHLLKAHFV